MIGKRHVKEQSASDKHETGEVKSAMEVALERAAHLDAEPIAIETEKGPVMMTFDELKSKAAQTDELLNQMKYQQAEFENYRKRTQREKEEYLASMVRVEDLLETVDYFDRALASEGDAKAIKDGIGLVRAQLAGLLERKGLERIETVGQPFDPLVHEAIAQQPHEEHPTGTVIAEYQPGYRLRERVIRPGKVVVSAGPGRS